MAQVRIDSLRGKEISLPHPGNGPQFIFVVGEDGLVSASLPDGEGGRQIFPLSNEAAEEIVRHYHLNGAVAVPDEEE